MIGQNPKAEVAPFFVGGNRDNQFKGQSSGQEIADTASRAPKYPASP